MLLWLTLLALPGLAAATAQPCAPHGHVPAPLAASAGAPLQMGMQTHTGALDTHRIAHAITHQPAPPAACHDGAVRSHRHRHGEHGEHAHGRCSACAACCAGVAPAPAFAPTPGGPAAAFVAVPFRPGHLPSVDPFLLERPPRPAFA